MRGEFITLKTTDGDFSAYVARPKAIAGSKAPAVVVLQEIFGVNAVMRDITDGLAGQGYLTICPDLFWRLRPGVDITDQSPEEWKVALDLMGRFNADTGVVDIQAAIDFIRIDPGCSGKVGTVGFCLGGKLAYLAATRTNADACIAYYGVGLENLLDEPVRAPLMLHIAGKDSFSSDAARAALLDRLTAEPRATIHLYPERDHAFARPGGEHYHEADAMTAGQRSLDFFNRALG